MHLRRDVRLRMWRLSMTVHVDELSSDVVVEPERGTSVVSSENGETPLRADDLRALQAALARDRARTHAESYSD